MEAGVFFLPVGSPAPAATRGKNPQENLLQYPPQHGFLPASLLCRNRASPVPQRRTVAVTASVYPQLLPDLVSRGSFLLRLLGCLFQFRTKESSLESVSSWHSSGSAPLPPFSWRPSGTPPEKGYPLTEKQLVIEGPRVPEPRRAQPTVDRRERTLLSCTFSGKHPSRTFSRIFNFFLAKAAKA